METVTRCVNTNTDVDKLSGLATPAIPYQVELRPTSR